MFSCFCESRKVTGKTLPLFREDMLTTPTANLRLGQDKEEIWISVTDHRSTSRVFTKLADMALEFILWPLRDTLQRNIQ